MKVVKLNRRFKMYKNHGHEIALRFSNWGDRARAFEQAAKHTFGPQYTWSSTYETWHSYFGKADGRNSNRPFWITFRNAADLTLIMLRVDQKS